MKPYSWLLSFLLVFGLAYSRAGVGDVIYLHPDISRTPVLATGNGGEVLWRHHYSSFGELQEYSGHEYERRIDFHGHSYDEDTGLIFMGRRYYDPDIGRFVNVDPAPINVGSVHGFNRYSFAYNNPDVYLDPDGRVFVPIVLFAVGAGINLTARYISSESVDWGSAGVWVDAGVAGLSAAVTGGAAGLLFSKAAQGAIGSSTAILATGAIGGAAGGASSVASDLIVGRPVSSHNAMLGVGTGMVGSLIGARLGMPPSIRNVENMMNSQNGILNHIGGTSRSAMSTSFQMRSGLGQSSASYLPDFGAAIIYSRFSGAGPSSGSGGYGGPGAGAVPGVNQGGGGGDYNNGGGYERSSDGSYVIPIICDASRGC